MPVCYWLTGLSAAGKTTLARAFHERLREQGIAACVLDGDEMRLGLNADLGFSRADRAENTRRLGEVARLMADAGLVVIVAAISPYREDRAKVRERFAARHFVEVFVDADLETCARRDPKGLYRRARAAELGNLTGVSDPYEAPLQPDIHMDSVNEAVALNTARLLAWHAEKSALFSQFSSTIYCND